MAANEREPNIVTSAFHRLGVEPVIEHRKTFGAAVILATTGIIFTASGASDIGNAIITLVQNQNVRDFPDTIMKSGGKIVAGLVLMLMGNTGIFESLERIQDPKYYMRAVRTSRPR